MQVSARADYALRAAAELARAAVEGTGPLKGELISQEQVIPKKFMENILLDLKHSGIVRTQRGAAGGYWLSRPASEISLAQVIRAVEGPLANIRGEWPEAVEYRGANLRAVLETVTLADLVGGSLPTPIEKLTRDPEAWIHH